MVICRKCKHNEWRIFEESSQKKKRLQTKTMGIVYLECIECGNKQYAYYKDGKITIPRKDIEITNDYSFDPLNCSKPSCGGNRWKILQGEMVCERCKQKIELHIGNRISKQSRPRKKVGDYYP